MTQGPIPDLKCKLNISSFLTLPQLLDCLICTRNSMSIVLLLQMMEGWDRWGVVDLLQGVGGGDRGWVLSCSLFFLFVYFFTCVFVLCSLMSSVPFSSD